MPVVNVSVKLKLKSLQKKNSFIHIHRIRCGDADLSGSIIHDALYENNEKRQDSHLENNSLTLKPRFLTFAKERTVETRTGISECAEVANLFTTH